MRMLLNIERPNLGTVENNILHVGKTVSVNSHFYKKPEYINISIILAFDL